jgi:two-component system, OmpR family, osmolarity sensor histidine kinase EnvZ
MPRGIRAGRAHVIARTLQRAKNSFSISLFWRTFFLLSGLLAACTAAWVQIAIEIESTPRAQQSAQQVSTLINLSRAALIHADPIYRISLIKSMANQEGVHIWPKESNDVIATPLKDTIDKRLRAALINKLGEETIVSSSVNGQPGMWVSFAIEGDEYWLAADPSRLTPVTSRAWLLWLTIAFCVAVAGAVLIARRLSEPLKSLARATIAVRRGNFESYRLDEAQRTTEIREVNRGFNAMAAQLAKLEQDRMVMMAGLSHDLRTPLTRLRLEAEMSVADPDARDGMASDIDQLDQIISKFLDYARPTGREPSAVDIAELVDTRMARLSIANDGLAKLQVNNNLPKPLWILADATDLGRVISNILENARRYGATPGSDPATTVVDIEALPRTSNPRGPGGDGIEPGISQDSRVVIRVRDHGKGVSPEDLPHLLTPFYRADASRSQVVGSGLGLSIVDKAVKQMGGRLLLSNCADGGLAVDLDFRLASDGGEA